MNQHLTRTLALFALVTAIAATPTQGQTPAESKQTEDRSVVDLQHQGPHRVVYQVTADEWKDGVGKAFLYLRHLHAYYQERGIEAKHLDIRAVVHGEASYQVLSDEAYNRVKEVATGNPNTELLAELKRKRVQIELCDTRRRHEGWSKSDIHPDVLLAKDAYARLIDLQMQGYAYIKY